MRKKMSVLLAIVMVLTIVGSVSPISIVLGAVPSGITDSVQCGVSGSESTHSLATSGTTGSTTDTAKTGLISESYTARYVQTSGSYFQYTLAIGQNMPLAIQIREVRPNPHWGYNYGYDVYLNNTLVYKKDSNVAGKGGGSYLSTFIETSDPAIIGGTTVTLKIVSNSSNPAYFTDIWVYKNLDAYVADSGMNEPMTIAPMIGKNRDLTSALQGKITNDVIPLHTSSYVNKGFSVLYDFLFKSTDETQQAAQSDMASELQKLIDLARNNNVPVQLKFNTEWGGTPKTTSDGLGGTFGDIKYQQILWSDNDQYNDPGLSTYLGGRYNVKYGLSIPNVWADTPWLTYNNSYLNDFVSSQFNKGIIELNNDLYELQRDGKNLLLPLTNATETLYWAKVNGAGSYDVNYQNQVNGGVERYNLWGDFNNDTLSAAAADGVTLDPSNGLDFNTEKEWLHNNLAKHAQRLIDDIYYKLNRERIQGNSGTLSYPVEMLRHKIFTESYAAKSYPLYSDTRPVMETGIVSRSNPGSEYFIPTQLAHLLKQREFGRVANPNFETTGVRDWNDKLAILRQLFAMGGDHVSVYNYSTDLSQYVNGFVDNTTQYDSGGSNQNASSAIGVAPMSSSETIGQTFTSSYANLFIDEVGFKVEKVGDTSNVTLKVSVYDSPSKTKLLGERQLTTSELPAGYNWANVNMPLTSYESDAAYYMEISEPGMTSSNYYAILANNGNNYSGGQYYYNGSPNSSIDMIFGTGNISVYDATGSNLSAPSGIGIGPSSSSDRMGQTFKSDYTVQMLNEIGLKVQKVGDISNVKLKVEVWDSPSKTKLYTMRLMSSSELPTGYNWASIYLPIMELEANTTYYVEITEPGMTADNYYALLGNNSSNYVNGQFYYNGTPNSGVDMVFRTGAALMKERNKSRLVEFRREAKDTIAEATAEKLTGDTYVQSYLNEANTQYNNGQYKTSYQKAIKADSHRYPILYQVKGSAATNLSPFPMSVNPQSKVVNVDVTAYNSTANTLNHTFMSYATGNVTLTYTGGLASKHVYINSVDRGVGSVTFNVSSNTTYSVEVR